MSVTQSASMPTVETDEKRQGRGRSASFLEQLAATRAMLSAPPVPSISSLFQEYAVNTTDEDLKAALMDLSENAKHTVNMFMSKDAICNMAKFACIHSASLKAVTHCVSKFIEYCNTTGADINDETWYYVFDGQGPEMIELSIRGRGTLDIIRFLIDRGFATTWRPLIRAACCADKLDILMFLVESGVTIQWELDEECCNDYNYTKSPKIRKYLREVGKKMGITAAEFRYYDTV
jgi:hypothetical protein